MINFFSSLSITKMQIIFGIKIFYLFFFKFYLLTGLIRMQNCLKKNIKLIFNYWFNFFVYKKKYILYNCYLFDNYK